MANKRNGILVYALLLMAAFSFRAAVARLLPNDAPFDGKVYAQIARNVLEQHSYSHATEPPYEPSIIRLPGYPLFIAGIYSVFGHGDNVAVRIVQALLDTATCALIAFIAFFWEPDQKLNRRSSIAALALAALCPFTTIYVATILTETATTFLAVAMCLTATLALKTTRNRDALLLWAATGVLAGVAVLFRPDSGLFALAIGITLVVTTLLRSSDVKLSKKREEVLYRFSRASYLGAVFSLAFCLVLVPWTIRNSRVFHLFQPLAPAHAEMPGEFVPRGYQAWLRTWIDDGRYVETVLWPLDDKPISLDDMPESAFDSEDEESRVADLLEQYNNPAQTDEGEPTEEPSPSPTPAAQGTPTPAKPEQSPSPLPNETKSEEAGADDESDTEQTEEPAEPQTPEMTPAIDAAFGQLARERIARAPLRYYVWLPLKRARALWVGPHSDYYPFSGE